MSFLQLFQGGGRDLRERPPENLPGLDVLRSIAVLLVFTTHFGNEFGAIPKVAELPPFDLGWSGVDLFFVLSGLLIGTQLWKELRKTGGIRIGRFLLRRGLRIWPLYFSFVALVTVIVAHERGTLRSVLPDAVFLSNYLGGQIGGGWSLSTEEQFYILAPVSIALIAAFSARRCMWMLPVAMFLFPLGARVIHVQLTTSQGHALRDEMYFPIHTHSEGLAIGMLLAWVTVFHPDWLTPKRSAIAAAAMVVVGAIVYQTNHILFSFTALALIYGAAVLLCMILRTNLGLLNWRGFYLISRLSYGIYLNHFRLMPALHAVLGGWRERQGEAAFWACYLICFAVSMAVAWITFHLIEWPFLRIRSQWLQASRTRADVVHAG
ncbi:MAG: acyltransferase [Acidobacteriia bacterium]|nr:acyltransferase [Terriglobia bacterium]